MMKHIQVTPLKAVDRQRITHVPPQRDSVANEYIIHRIMHQFECFDTSRFGEGKCEVELVHAHADRGSIPRVEGTFFNPTRRGVHDGCS